MSAREDLEDYLRDRLNTLGDDMMWRCQEADLKPADWHAMLILTFMQGAANTIAQAMPARADAELVKGFHELIVYARQKVRERERQERREQ